MTTGDRVEPHRHRRYRLDGSRAVGVVVLAAGSGERLGAGPKAFVELAGEPLLWHVLRSVTAARSVAAVVVAAPPASIPEVERVVRRIRPDLPARVVGGGSSRQSSALAGMTVLPPDLPWVAVTDVARPLTAAQAVDELLDRLYDHAGDGPGPQPCGIAPMVPIVDSVHRIGAGSWLAGPVDRSTLLAAQTPQLFRRECLTAAYAGGLELTDDVGLMSAYGGSVLAAPGDRTNLKVTYPEDTAVAEALHHRTGAGSTGTGWT
jgi:2-C-methyl-D-erythritol 4-phosphate cytidylyltransferase/2-C-methyl-D-erythritol 4-phosphate cytidylyltransferase/2-C-methyl-D-erythritol 2,4-cyclodiphosphate synthase